ncbi:MAG TPA: sodium ion-translocating decarboxylase subunit beta, partial [Bacteroidales bacterium]|nr:sodium ion-translocating decarboxylase subunit beta [Bacteroidales bacterium]
DRLHPSKHEIKNLRAVKIAFPIVLGTVIIIIVPSAAPLLGMLLFGNLIKEIGTDTQRLTIAATDYIMNPATIFLGLTVGATMTSEVFLKPQTLMIIVGGFFAFAISVAGGIYAVKLTNLFSKKKINPLCGATGLSAVPMASRVANEIALKYDKSNHVLQYCMSSNVSGVIGSAVAAGVLIGFLQ